MKHPIRILLIVLLAMAMAACTKKVKDVPPPPDESTPAPVVETAPAAAPTGFTAADLETNECLRQRVVYFDFDQAEIKGEAQAVLACHGKYLNDVPGAKMTLEGHADERGSREYNLGLGERRGNAVSSALQVNGGMAAQITVNSYGEERPTCLESDEMCWAKNRRVEIVYTQAQ